MQTRNEKVFIPLSVFGGVITALGMPCNLEEFAQIVADRDRTRYCTVKVDNDVAVDGNTSIQAILVMAEFLMHASNK